MTPKIGILVVAYNAESTIEETLSRIPYEISKKLSSILVSDDSSMDLTHKVALNYANNSELPIDVIVQPINLGYGGNQKFGYAWAINHDWDIVILLHADGQYAPEYLEEIIKPFNDPTVGAVFGSRMIIRKNALIGGMPLYKWLGNQILTFIQNKLTKNNLSEWHSGYRAYRVSILKKIELKSLSNGFRFDTQIILEVIRLKSKIVEVPIPTFYGDEVSHVNGLKYAREIIWDTVKFRIRNGVS